MKKCEEVEDADREEKREQQELGGVNVFGQFMA